MTTLLFFLWGLNLIFGLLGIGHLVMPASLPMEDKKEIKGLIAKGLFFLFISYIIFCRFFVKV